YPSLAIELVLTDAYLDLIEERVDVAIRLGSLQDSSYIAKLIKPIQFIICASPDYIEKYGIPTKPEEASKHNCLIFPRAGHNNNWLFKDENQEIYEIQIQGQCTITNSTAIKQCAVLGMGLALLPDWLVNNDIKGGILERLYDDYSVTATDYNSGIYVLYPSKKYTPLKTRLFIEHLQKNIQSE
ncbi:MAG TPA: LysR family transcriptional regulator, partial [Gammaproteobacteria bacterium]|nr:LysR family transcriptional regulator [Gammaproteobacteria bacterium]